MTSEHRFVARTTDDMRAIGQRLGEHATGGDVLVLTGDLGAGKTTLTQGIAAGMGIEERVTSPTFVIARIHDNPSGGPLLAHVDAYRLGSLAEVDDLDLDADLEASVIVVEWGAGLVDDLSESRVDVMITRSDSEHDEGRMLQITARSATWTSLLSAIESEGAFA
jgi:tRNA threonylcarbamoyladenosine biosynthesis protein TsaE